MHTYANSYSTAMILTASVQQSVEMAGILLSDRSVIAIGSSFKWRNLWAHCFIMITIYQPLYTSRSASLMLDQHSQCCEQKDSVQDSIDTFDTISNTTRGGISPEQIVLSVTCIWVHVRFCYPSRVAWLYMHVVLHLTCNTSI